MTNNEANKIIAEFMGEEIYEKLPFGNCAIASPAGDGRTILKTNYYTTSLDSLVSPLEKISGGEKFCVSHYINLIFNNYKNYIAEETTTFTQGLTHGLAMLIESQKDKDE